MVWDNSTNMAWHRWNDTLLVLLRLVRWHVHAHATVPLGPTPNLEEGEVYELE